MSEPTTILEWLVNRYPTAKRQTLKRMVEAGRVSVNGVVARKLKEELAAGAKVCVDERPDAKPTPKRKYPLLNVVYEDADILVVNKPSGLLTSTVPKEPRPTLLALVQNYMLDFDPKARVGLIHRLDREAAGLLIFSKNNNAYESLKTQLFKHTMDRVYLAVVYGNVKPAKGRIESNLVERADGKVHSTRQVGKGEPAITDYEVIKSNEKYSLVRLTLHTGRKHQIRVHMSEKGWPIVGDSMYGGKAKSEKRLMLMSVKLTVQHPRTEKEMTFELPASVEMEELVGGKTEC